MLLAHLAAHITRRRYMPDCALELVARASQLRLRALVLLLQKLRAAQERGGALMRYERGCTHEI